MISIDSNTSEEGLDSYGTIGSLISMYGSILAAHSIFLDAYKSRRTDVLDAKEARKQLTALISVLFRAAYVYEKHASENEDELSESLSNIIDQITSNVLRIIKSKEMKATKYFNMPEGAKDEDE